MTRGKRPRACRICGNKLSTGGQHKGCPRCGYKTGSTPAPTSDQEKPVLRCYQNKSLTCNLKKLKMAPSNFCSQTETRCKRLKRNLKLRRQKGPVPVKEKEPTTVMGTFMMKMGMRP